MAGKSALSEHGRSARTQEAADEGGGMNALANCASVATRGTPVKDASRRKGGGLKAVLDRGPTRRHRVFRPGRRNDPVQPNKETSLARVPWLLHTLTDTTVDMKNAWAALKAAIRSAASR